MRILLAMDQAEKDQFGLSRCLELAELAEQLLWQAEWGLQQLASSLWLSRCLELAEQPFQSARLWHAHAPKSLAEWALQEAPVLSMIKKCSLRCPQSKSSCWQADLIESGSAALHKVPFASFLAIVCP